MMEKERRILVVDEDPFERISCRVMLRGTEFMVLFCEDADSAINRVSKEEFELIITNIRLPNKYIGLTVVQEMKLLQPKADIVVMAERPSIWDARESVRLGACGYAERPLTPECLMHVARKKFDKKGWIVKKGCIDQFRDYVAPSPEMDNPLIYYKNGSWARHLEGGLWEVGYDMKYWLPSGRYKNNAWATHLDACLQEVDYDKKSRLPYDQVLSISLSDGLATLVAGEPYARVSSSTGKACKLHAPMTGAVKEVNGEANEMMMSRIPEDRGLDWQLWLARIQAEEWEYGNARAVEEGNLIGTYCTV